MWRSSNLNFMCLYIVYSLIHVKCHILQAQVSINCICHWSQSYYTCHTWIYLTRVSSDFSHHFCYPSKPTACQLLGSHVQQPTICDSLAFLKDANHNSFTFCKPSWGSKGNNINPQIKTCPVLASLDLHWPNHESIPMTAVKTIGQTAKLWFNHMKLRSPKNVGGCHEEVPSSARPLVVFVVSIRKLGSCTSSTYETNWNLHLTKLSFLVVGLKDSSGFPYKFTALSYKGWKFSSNRTPLPMSSPLSRAICWLWALMPTESGLQPCNWRDGNRKYIIIVVYIVHTYLSICTCVCIYIDILHYVK